MEKPKVRKTVAIVWCRIWEEKSVWIIFFISVAIIIVAHIGNKEDVLKGFGGFLEVASEYKTEIVGLAVSYIAGLIFYVFSSLFPYAKNSRTILPDIIEELRYLKDDFYELSSDLSGCDWCNDNTAKTKAVDDIISRSVEKCNSYELSQYHKDMFDDFVSKLDERVLYVIKHSHGYLEDDELAVLIDIRKSDIIGQFRVRKANSTSFTLGKTRMNEIIFELVSMNKKLLKTYEKLRKRIYTK